MTPEDWEKVLRLERADTGASVKLRIDGYDVSVVRGRANKTKDFFMIYVNGSFKGEWMIVDCEERRRFFKAKKSYLFNDKHRQEMTKAAANRKVSKDFRDWNKKMLEKNIVLYAPYWNSISSLKRHLIANNNSIELINE